MFYLETLSGFLLKHTIKTFKKIEPKYTRGIPLLLKQLPYSVESQYSTQGGPGLSIKDAVSETFTKAIFHKY